ncbi:MAG: GNAT family N-acetyltransferase [Oscillospiraceae bacterium]|jgi:GNAT superfamily N-acetyltransferase|uniref:GNAT family N-acetyltransferase n=1 Tax=Faecalibacterium prausnitzii TaxID=853 RepID=UPI000E47793D|nr:GNAT family N-acetyltransferase [Faecalibacterium prausnitzii]RHC43828.1 N-acetyltransferase [Faecalibacterium prausnitzii]UYI70090.1 MAG: GNAT family N-acetyltransferase [Oscillospiraceae bacterium]
MWEPRTYDPSRFDDILEMSIENYGKENDICDPAFLKHQYFENPAGDALIELAVDPENGTLAGQYVVQPAKIRVFGKDEKCVISLNTLTRKAYRGQKIFVRLAERTYERAAREGYALVYGAPNKNSYPGFMKKLAFKDIHHFPLYARPLNLNHMVMERMNNSALAAIATPFQVFFPNKGASTENIVELTEQNVGLFDAFWDKIKDKYNIMGVRDSEYIRYRYMNVPRREYYPYAAIKDGQIVAYAVGRIREVAGFETGMIADFLFLRGYEKDAEQLVKNLVKRMKDEGASLAACVILANAEETKVLKKCGFYRIPDKILPQPTPLILRVLGDDSEEKLSDINNWFFTTGDYDVV